MRWHVHVDGASSGNPGKSGAGIVVRDDGGEIVFARAYTLAK
jgi:ribonuclease HI